MTATTTQEWVLYTFTFSAPTEPVREGRRFAPSAEFGIEHLRRTLAEEFPTVAPSAWTITATR